MKLNAKNANILDIDSDLDEIRAEIDAIDSRVGGAPILPAFKNFGDYLIWSTFSKAVQDKAPEALRSGAPCVVFLAAGEHAKFFYSSLKPMLETGFRYNYSSGYSDKTSVLNLDAALSRGKLTKYENEDIFEHVLANPRFFAVCKSLSEDFIATDVLDSADAAVDVSVIDPQHIIDGLKGFFQFDISNADADLISAVPLPTICAAFREGRSLEKSLFICKAAAQRSPSQNKSDGPTLDDLHGLGEAADWGRDLAIDLSDWKNGKISWSDVDRGVLISGAPGTGKTTYSSALARTCGVPVIHTSVAQWQAAGHLGDMLKAMRSSFAEAKTKAPCILFIDEIDSIGDRTKFSGDYARYSTEVVNALLECLDGADGREGVVVVGATNFPNSIDAGIKRAGRLDRHIHIPLPDQDGREGILRWHLKDALESESLESVISRTEGASGADLEQLVRGAKRIARRCRRGLTVDDLLDQLPPLVPCPPEELWRVAVHEAGHAIVGLASEFWTISEIKISKAMTTTTSVGGVVLFHDKPSLMSTIDSYHARIRRSFGGIAAEEVVLGSRSDGSGGLPGSDLHAGTLHAIAIEASLGLGSTLIHLSDLDEPSLRRAFHAFPSVREGVKVTLDACFAEAKNIIQLRRRDVEKLASALMNRGRLTGAEIEDLLCEAPVIAMESHVHG